MKIRKVGIVNHSKTSSPKCVKNNYIINVILFFLAGG